MNKILIKFINYIKKTMLLTTSYSINVFLPPMTKEETYYLDLFFKGEKEKTQKEIAKSLHISRSYVSRIEKRALIKMLREFIKNENV